MKRSLLIISLVLLSLVITSCKGYAARLHYEKVYQNAWCAANGGIRPPTNAIDDYEWRLPDGSRADCVTKDFAIEFDFADKWAESPGQSALYAYILRLTPGIVIISENGEKDLKYLERMEKALQKLNGRRWFNKIKLWVMTPEDLYTLKPELRP